MQQARAAALRPFPSLVPSSLAVSSSSASSSSSPAEAHLSALDDSEPHPQPTALHVPHGTGGSLSDSFSLVVDAVDSPRQPSSEHLAMRVSSAASSPGPSPRVPSVLPSLNVPSPSSTISRHPPENAATTAADLAQRTRLNLGTPRTDYYFNNLSM